MANKLIQDLGTQAFAFTDLLEKQPIAGPPSTKGDVTALAALLNTDVSHFMRAENLAGADPAWTPAGGVGIGVDTSNDRIFWYYSGAWH